MNKQEFIINGILSIIEKYNKPIVSIEYGYNYNENPSYSGGEIIPEWEFYICETYGKPCQEDQSSRVANSPYYYGVNGLQREYKNFPKKVFFSEDAKRMSLEIVSFVRNNHDSPYDHTEFYLYKAGINKKDIFEISVKQTI